MAQFILIASSWFDGRESGFKNGSDQSTMMQICGGVKVARGKHGPVDRDFNRGALLTNVSMLSMWKTSLEGDIVKHTINRHANKRGQLMIKVYLRKIRILHGRGLEYQGHSNAQLGQEPCTLIIGLYNHSQFNVSLRALIGI